MKQLLVAWVVVKIIVALALLASCQPIIAGTQVRIYWYEACPYCKQELAEVNEVYDEWLKRGISVVTINVADSQAAIDRVVTERGYKFLVERGRLPAIGVPYTEVYIDGVIVARRLGYVSVVDIEIILRGGGG